LDINLQPRHITDQVKYCGVRIKDKPSFSAGPENKRRKQYKWSRKRKQWQDYQPDKEKREPDTLKFVEIGPHDEVYKNQ